MRLKDEKLWILGSLIVGFLSAFCLYLIREAGKAEVLELGLLFSFMLWFITVVKRVLSGRIKKGFLATIVKVIILIGALGGLTALTLSTLGVIN